MPQTENSLGLSAGSILFCAFTVTDAPLDLRKALQAGMGIITPDLQESACIDSKCFAAPLVVAAHIIKRSENIKKGQVQAGANLDLKI